MKNLIITIISSVVISGGVYVAIEFVYDTTGNDVLHPIYEDYIPTRNYSQTPLSKKFKSSSKSEVRYVEEITGVKYDPFSGVINAPANGGEYTNLSSKVFGNYFSVEHVEKKNFMYKTNSPGSSMLAVAFRRSTNSNIAENGISSLPTNMKFFAADMPLISTLDVSDTILAPAEQGEDDLYELPLIGGEFVLLLLIGLYAIYFVYKRNKKMQL